MTTRVVPPFLKETANNFKALKSKCLPATASTTSLDKVAKFYADLWKRPEMKYKIEKWASIKRKKPSEGPPSGADLKILAVAVDNTHSQSELVTFDHDYIVFSDEITRDLGIMVTNGFLL